MEHIPAFQIAESRGALRHRPLKSDIDLNAQSVNRFMAITIVLTALSSAAWLAAASARISGNIVAIGIFGTLVTAVILCMATGRSAYGLAVIAYLAAVQPMIRQYGTILPYFALEYTVPIWFVLLVLQHRDRITLRAPFIWYSMYLFLELVGTFLTNFSDLVRGVVIPSFILGVFLFISSQVRIDKRQMLLIVHGYLIGALSIGAIIARVYFSGQLIIWTTNSNFTASGGMGPVQVGFLLSVACFLCLVMFEQQRGLLRYCYLAVCFALTYIMIMTFARGGLYIFGGATILYTLVFRKPSAKSIGLVVLCMMAVVLIFSFAIKTTEGVVIERYSEQDTSNRGTLVEQGWRIFLDHPLFGVGTSNYHEVVSRAEYFGKVSGAHNEFIRAASEHGILGLIVWLGFAVSVVRQTIKQPSGNHRAIKLVIVLIAFISMFYNGLKLITQPLLFMMALSLDYSSSTPLDATTDLVEKNLAPNLPSTRSTMWE
jgi:O-antigen ligase